MAHAEQREFCQKIRNIYPAYFTGKKVLDVGSLDVNGNNHYLLTDCIYTGLDVGKGPNVDIVCPGHEYDAPSASFDLIISTECFEHDMHYAKTLANIVRLLKPGGMFLFTCATTGREEHGTNRSKPNDAPLLNSMPDEWANYYKNLTEDDIRRVIDIDNVFQEFAFTVNPEAKDLYFYGIKK